MQLLLMSIGYFRMTSATSVVFGITCFKYMNHISTDSMHHIHEYKAGNDVSEFTHSNCLVKLSSYVYALISREHIYLVSG